MVNRQFSWGGVAPQGEGGEIMACLMAEVLNTFMFTKLSSQHAQLLICFDVRKVNDNLC